MKYSIRAVGITVLCICILSASAYAIPVGFIDMKLDENLDKLHVKTMIMNPEPVTKGCHDDLGNCTKEFMFTTWSWLATDTPEEAELRTQRMYIFSHPETKAYKIDNCSDLAIGYILEPNILLRLNRSKDPPFDIDILPSENTTISLAILNDSHSSCTYFDFFYLNPNLVDKRNQFFYPFDTYTAVIGIYIPGKPYANVEMEVPDDFKINNIMSSPTTNKKFNTENIAFVAYNLYENKTTVTITFARYKDLSDFIYPLFSLLTLPIIIMFYVFYLYKSKDETTNKNIKYLGFVFITLPLFFNFASFYTDKPSVFTVLDISFILSVLFMIFGLYIIQKTKKVKGKNKHIKQVICNTQG